MHSACSVIICTRNPRLDYLSRALAALREQTLPVIEWELLLIDNGSQNPLQNLVDLSWHPTAHIVHEPEPGLTPARLRAIAEAEGELIIFVDDDNVLDSSYLSESMRIAQQFPCLGAWGGQLLPEFEIPPAPGLEDLVAGIAVREFHETRWSNYDRSTCPYGAGLCVRISVADRYAQIVATDPIRRSLDRRGSSLIGGEDLDLAMTSYQNGYGYRSFSQAQIASLNPQTSRRERLSLPNLRWRDLRGSFSKLLAFRSAISGSQILSAPSEDSQASKAALTPTFGHPSRKSRAGRNSTGRERYNSPPKPSAFAWDLTDVKKMP